MKLRWDRRALQDLRDILNYAAEHGSPVAANRLRKHLVGRIDRLRTNPFIGVASSNPAIRTLLPTRYPYRVYYSVQDGEIVVLHIRHTARQTPGDLGQ